MASVSITNQTLTMTITIDGVDTVIRKDNCKVQAFGDVVRITDYKGSIYEFLFSDCTSPSEASANDLRDAIEEFLNTGGGGGGGITSLTSTDGSIDIDNIDPSAPDLSIPSGLFTPTFTELAAGNTDSVSPISSFSYVKIGSIVTISGYFSAIGDGTTISINFQLVVPDIIKPNNNFSDFYQAFSVVQQTNNIAKSTITVGANSGNKNLYVSLSSDSVESVNFDIVFTCTYSIDI